MKTSYYLGLLCLALVTACDSSPVTTRPKTKETTPATGKDKPTVEAQKKSRLQWNLNTLVKSYDKVGRHNSRWDKAATAALAAFANLRTTGHPVDSLQNEIKQSTTIAVQKGCQDPLVKYLHARYGLATENEEDILLRAEALQAAAQALSESEYPAVRKFYACVRAAEALHLQGSNHWNEVVGFRKQAIFFWVQTLQDSSVPLGEVYDGCNDLLNLLERNPAQYGNAFLTFEPLLDRHWPKESITHLIKGQFYKRSAWQARGSGLADTVSEAGWKTFAERLDLAEKSLTKAWELDPGDDRSAVVMIVVAMGKEQEKDQMELWFTRAMTANPNSYEACKAKRNFLEPKWGGTPQDMLAFGHECLNSTNWGGMVPLTLVDAHQSLAGYLDKDDQVRYWKQPEVWLDIKAAFDKYLQANPEDTTRRHWYVLWAFRAGQWEELNRQVELMGPVNHAFFGGREAFESMMRQAKAKVKTP
jgi:hypothetical protein